MTSSIPDPDDLGPPVPGQEPSGWFVGERTRALLARVSRASEGRAHDRIEREVSESDSFAHSEAFAYLADKSRRRD